MDTKTSSGGMGLASWLTLLFIGLKLTGYISWSWWWVFAPIWITLGAVAVFLLVGAVIIALLSK